MNEYFGGKVKFRWKYWWYIHYSTNSGESVRVQEILRNFVSNSKLADAAWPPSHPETAHDEDEDGDDDEEDDAGHDEDDDGHDEDDDGHDEST